MGFNSQEVGAGGEREEKTNDCDEVTPSRRVLITCRLCSFAVDTLFMITARLTAPRLRRPMNNGVRKNQTRHCCTWTRMAEYNAT